MKTISSRPFLSSCIALMSAIFISACGDDNSSSATDSPIESSSSIEYIEPTINSSADSDSVESSSRHTISSSSTTTVSSSSIESSNSSEVTSSSSTKEDTVVVSSSSYAEDESSSSINNTKEESSSSMENVVECSSSSEIIVSSSSEKKVESSSSSKIVESSSSSKIVESSSSEEIVNSSSSIDEDYVDENEPKSTEPHYVELDELKLNGFRVENNIAYLSWENNTDYTMQINVEYHIECKDDLFDEDEELVDADSTIMYTIKANCVKEKAIYEIKNNAQQCVGYVKTITATENDKSNFAGWKWGSDRGIEDIAFYN